MNENIEVFAETLADLRSLVGDQNTVAVLKKLRLLSTAKLSFGDQLVGHDFDDCWTKVFDLLIREAHQG